MAKLNNRESAGSLRKAGSIASLFGDRIRKDIKRAESMKADFSKKPRRTPSFTTRRRTQSFRKLQKLEQHQLDQLPPVEIQGILDRKHELQSGGKKAPVRSWKTMYTVLCGQLLCFFKDQEDFINSKAATSPIIIHKAHCKKAQDYTKRKHVFRLCCQDGSEFLFLANTELEMEDWINKISFHANLPPSLQLLSYDDSQKDLQLPVPYVSSSSPIADSSGSSRSSTPEISRRSSVLPNQCNNISTAPTGKSIITAPRSAPPPIPLRGTLPADSGIKLSADMGETKMQYYPTQRSRSLPHDEVDWKMNNSMSYNALPTVHEPLPPLPATGPPVRTFNNRVTSAGNTQSSWTRHSLGYNIGMAPSAGRQVNQNASVNNSNRASTLPPYVNPPSHNIGSMYHPVIDDHAHKAASESSSESEQHIVNCSRKDKRSNVLTTLFRKKRVTNL